MTLSSVYFCEIKCPYKHKTILLWKVCTLWADLFVAYNLIYISIRNPKLSFFKTVGVSTTTQAEKSKKISKSLQDDDFGSILDTMRYCKKAFMMMNVSFDLTFTLGDSKV